MAQAKVTNVHFGFKVEEALEIVKREIEQGVIVEVMKGYDAWGRFDGSVMVNVKENPDLIKRRKER